MELGAAAQYISFAVFSLIAVGGALGMATTMSMFRSGIFLMASFIGVAGLFILLLADLLALLQVMMYIGGMLVMILFMVLFSHDPGGEMMTSMMELPFIEKLFSLGLAPSQHGEEHPGSGHGEGHDGGGGHSEHQDHQHQSGHDEHGGGDDEDQEEHGGGHEGMDMQEMSMTTPIKKPAAVLAGMIGLLLTGLILLRPAWPESNALPDQDSPALIGHLLMSKYMIAFEGAGMLILLGIFGAVLLGRPRDYSDLKERERIQAAVAEDPAGDGADSFEPECHSPAIAGGDEEPQ